MSSDRTTLLNKKAFFEDLDYRPHPGQWEVHRSEAPRRVLACGVRWGKTLCVAMEGLAMAMAPSERSIGWVVAPTYDLADRVFREVLLHITRHLNHRVVQLKESDRRIVLRDMGGGLSEIRAKSADNPVSLLGEGLDWLIIDEAARLKPTIWQSHLSQRLVDKRGHALLISTPYGKGYFFDLYRAGQQPGSIYESWNHPSWTNPHLDKSIIEDERGRLPTRIFGEQYEARFVEGSGAVLRYVREAAKGKWKPPVAGAEYFAGLDLAKVEDFTVLVILNDKAEVVFCDRFHRLDWSVQVQRILAACARYNNALVYIDSTGSGEPIYETLLNKGLDVQPYCLTARTKAALIDNLVMMFERREITLPTVTLWPEGIDELEAFEYSVTNSGHRRSGAPSGYHDDCVIALALAAWPLRDQPWEFEFHGPVEVAARMFPELFEPLEERPHAHHAD